MNFAKLTYKINIQKSVVFLFISNEQPKNKLGKIILFIMAYKRTEY